MLAYGVVNHVHAHGYAHMALTVQIGQRSHIQRPLECFEPGCALACSALKALKEVASISAPVRVVLREPSTEAGKQIPCSVAALFVVAMLISIIRLWPQC